MAETDSPQSSVPQCAGAHRLRGAVGEGTGIALGIDISFAVIHGGEVRLDADDGPRGHIVRPALPLEHGARERLHVQAPRLTCRPAGGCGTSTSARS